jgi:hypothetical protein
MTSIRAEIWACCSRVSRRGSNGAWAAAAGSVYCPGSPCMTRILSNTIPNAVARWDSGAFRIAAGSAIPPSRSHNAASAAWMTLFFFSVFNCNRWGWRVPSTHCCSVGCGMPSRTAVPRTLPPLASTAWTALTR